MKCPKCGYISFDHNHNCPKCKKLIREQAAKMSLPDYKPEPPALLGSLLGEEAEPSTPEELETHSFPAGGIEKVHAGTGAVEEAGEPAAAFDLSRDMEINFDDEESGMEASPQLNLPGLAEAVAEMDSSRDDAGEQPDLTFREAGIKDEAIASNTTASPERTNGMTETGLEFLDLSGGEQELPRADFGESGKDEKAASLPSEDTAPEEIDIGPLAAEEKISLEGAEAASLDEIDEDTGPPAGAEEDTVEKETPAALDISEIEFDLDRYQVTPELEEAAASSPEKSFDDDEGIPFDPGVLELEVEQKQEIQPAENDDLDAMDFGDIAELELEEDTAVPLEDDAAEVKEEIEEETIVLDDLDLEILDVEEDEEKG